MEEEGKTITSGPMIEILKVNGQVKKKAPVAANTVDLKVQLADVIYVRNVPRGMADVGDVVELKLEVGAIKVTKKKH